MIAVVAPLLPSTEHYTFEYYGHEKGLNSLGVKRIVQDKAGFLWVATTHGLFRYDGWRFRRFDTSDGLPASSVECLHVSADGVLWAGTRLGLARLVGERFQPVDLGLNYRVYARNGLDSSPDGRTLYLGTTEGLAIIDAGQDRQWQARVVRGPDPRRATVYGVHRAPDGRVWFGCGEDLCRLEGDRSEAVGAREGLPKDRWDSILTTADGTLWLRSSRRIFELPKGAGRFVDRGTGLRHAGFAGSLYLDRAGQLYAPTDGGLARYVAGKWQTIGLDSGLPSESTSTVLEDHEGSLWVGLWGAGLARWAGYREWTSWKRAQGLSSDSVSVMRRDHSGALWVGTDYGVNRLSPDGASWRSWSESDGLGGDKVRAIAIAGDGGVWAGAAPGGVSRIDPTTGRVRRFGPGDGIDSDRVNGLVVDEEDRVWVNTTSGLWRSAGSGASVRFTRVLPPGTDNGEGFFRSIVSRHGGLWIGTSKGLLRWQNGLWTRYTNANGLRSNCIGHVAETPDKAVWVGYCEDLGITRLRVDPTPSVEHFNRRNRLSSDFTLFLGVDPRGDLWFGGDNGVNVFNGKEWLHYDQADGLVWNNCTTAAFLAEGDGSIWIGTTRGLSRFRQIRERTTDRAEVLLTDVEFAGRKVNPAGADLSVPYGDRSLVLRFTTLNYRRSNDTSFRYRMLGLDEKWIETDQHEVRFGALPAGKYVFEVIAGSSTRGWGRHATRLAFEIQPPWWGSAWFITLAVLAGAAAVGVAWRWRIQQVLVRQQWLEDAVRQRTRELEAEKAKVLAAKARAEETSRYKSQFLANMSHEIRTPMNGLLGTADLLSECALNGEQREYVQTIQSCGQSLLTLLNDILDFSRIEAGRLDLHRVEFSLRSLLDESVRMLMPQAQAKRLVLRHRVDDSIPDRLSGDNARLRQVLLNLMSNAVKFTERGSVDVTVEPMQRRADDVVLRFSVTDTGIGIPPEKQDSVFGAFEQGDSSITRRYGGTGLGLSICSRLIELMGGRIWVESEAGCGSSFRFTVPLQYATRSHQPAEQHKLERLAQAVATASAARSLRILLAEDNPVNQKLAVRLLTKAGHEVSVAENGRRVLSLLDEEEYDLVLMDVQMPEMDGLQASAAIREKERTTGRRVPIVAMTANAMAGDRERCLSVGMDGYIAKPIRKTELFEVIANATS